jgi:hypothetical protein
MTSWTIDALPPKGVPVPSQLVAGSADSPDLMIARGLVNVRYGEALGLFDHLREVLVVDLDGVPEVARLFEDLLAEQAAHLLHRREDL